MKNSEEIKNYMRFVFDRKCINWEDSYDKNFAYLYYTEPYMNDILRLKGYLSLLDIYQYIGLPINFKEDYEYLVRHGIEYNRGIKSIEFEILNGNQKDTDLKVAILGDLIKYF